MRKGFISCLFFLSLFIHTASGQSVEKVAPGIWKVVYGTPEKYLPTDFKEKTTPIITIIQKVGTTG